MVVAVAAILRLWGLGADSFWIDEIRGVLGQRGLPLLDEVRQTFGPFDPPLSFVLYRLSALLPGSFEVTARLPSAVAGVVEVLAAYGAAVELCRRRREALVAGALLAVAPFAIRYAQEARYHVMLSAVAAGMWWAWLRACRRDGAAWRTWGVVAGVGVWTHPLASALLLAQVALASVAGRPGRTPDLDALAPITSAGAARCRRVGATALLSLVPWVLYGLVHWVGGGTTSDTLVIGARGVRPASLAGDLTVRGASWLLGNGPGQWQGLLLATLAMVAPALCTGRARRVAVAVVVYLAASIVTFWVLSISASTFLAYRRVEFLVPPLLLLVALGVGALADRARIARGDERVGTAVLSGAIAGLVVLSLGMVVQYQRSEKTDYRAMAGLVTAAPSDAVVVLGRFHDQPGSAWDPLLRRYLSRLGVDRPILSVDALDEADLPDAGEVLWLTGADPHDARFEVRPLDDLDRLQRLAGDESVGSPIIPAYALTSTYEGPGELEVQAEVVRGLGFMVVDP